MATNPVVNYGVNAYCEVSQITDAFGGFSLPSPSSQWTQNDNREIHRTIVDASQRIEAITGQYFGQFTDSIELDGNGTDYMPLSHVLSIPLASITTLKFREEFRKTYDWDASAETVDVDTYDVADDGAGLIRIGSSRVSNARESGGRAGIFVKGRKNYRVTGTFGGYSEVPQNIETACVLLSRDLIKPGWTERHEKFVTQHFPDGYSYARASNTAQNPTPTYTGILIVDTLLHAYVDNTPKLGIVR